MVEGDWRTLAAGGCSEDWKMDEERVVVLGDGRESELVDDEADAV